ncbi:MAG: DUF1232 domain-containing protein [Calditrichaeota bacterium]|nr:MAG: DUF1232 domain-containing protein [Calditrichota bacterium]
MKFRSLFVRGSRNPIGFLQAIFLLPKFIRLTFRLLLDSRVPVFPKIILVVTVIYAISPMDFIPELLLPIIGYSDDIVLLFFAGRYLLKSAPKEVMDEHVADIEGKKLDA